MTELLHISWHRCPRAWRAVLVMAVTAAAAWAVRWHLEGRAAAAATAHLQRAQVARERAADNRARTRRAEAIEDLLETVAAEPMPASPLAALGDLRRAVRGAGVTDIHLEIQESRSRGAGAASQASRGRDSHTPTPNAPRVGTASIQLRGTADYRIFRHLLIELRSLPFSMGWRAVRFDGRTVTLELIVPYRRSA